MIGENCLRERSIVVRVEFVFNIATSAIVPFSPMRFPLIKTKIDLPQKSKFVMFVSLFKKSAMMVASSSPMPLTGYKN